MTLMAAQASGVRLSELLAGIRPVPAALERIVTDVSADSRETIPGGCFLALRGHAHDGREFIDSAIAAGAAAVLAGHGGDELRAGGRVPVLTVPGLAREASRIAARFFGEPSRRMTVVGVTGTNGKTTVSQLVAQALEALAPSTAAVIGTLGYGRPGRLAPCGLTTPEAVRLQRLLAELAAAGARTVVLEVSSHALVQERVAAVRFDTAVFTNLGRDHLDFHEDLEAYGRAKARLFEHPGLQRAVLNLDDPYGRRLLAALPCGVQPYGYTLGTGRAATVRGELLALGADGLRVAVSAPGGRAEIDSPLLGRFNASNLLAATAVLLALGVPLAEAAVALGAARPVPGRLERLGGEAGAPLVLVDYAHTPDALEQALAAARALCRGRLWCVFGCGGDRDRGKRAQMGAVAAALADRVVLTSDNPRGEDPQRILTDIAAGVPAGAAVECEPDRARAIRLAVGRAGAEDVVLLAGKGHEEHQQVGARRLPFSDRAVALAALRERDR